MRSHSPDEVSGRPGVPFDDFSWSSVVEQSPVALVVLGAGRVDLGRILHANRAGRELLAGLVGAADRGLDQRPASIFDIVADGDRASMVGGIEQAARGGATPADGPETTTVHLDAGATPFTVHLSAGPDGTIVAQVVAASGGGSAEQALVQQQRFRSALMELTELADSTTDDDEFYQRLIERAVEVVPGAQGGSVQLNIEGTAAFRFVAASGFDLVGLQRHELERDHFFRDAWDPAARIVREFDSEGRSEAITEWLETVGRLSEIVVNVSAPVLVDGLPVAFLSLDNFDDPNAFTDTSVEMTTVLSRLIGTLWRRRHLEAELRREREAFRHDSLHDALTALPNRRSLEQLLADGLESARRQGRPSAVLFLDIDDFKGVNDRLGHEIGDQLLIGVANVLQDVIRLGDVVGRWGGDEFLVLPQRLETSAAAEELADRILDRFTVDLVLESGVSYRARLTVGIGWSETSATETGRLIATADRALYEAKAAGKGIARLHQV